MPSQIKGNVIQRQWEMLRLIPSHDHPGRSAAEIADALATRGYPVTRRTVERDLDGLAACMPLELDAKARPQRWRWQKSKALDVPGMEAAEAMALFMTRDALTQHLPSCFLEALSSRFAQANKTLAALSRAGRGARWSDRVRVQPSHVVLSPPAVRARLMQTLQHALLNDVALDVLYRSAREKAPSARILYPRGLILRGSSLYLIAHQKGSNEPPHFYAVQRFESCRLKELEPWPAGKFSLDAFLAEGTNQFGEGKAITLKATISPELHRTLGDHPLSADMKVAERDGALNLTATVRDTWALRTWVLGHAEHIRVEYPQVLRAAVSERLKAAAARYA